MLILESLDLGLNSGHGPGYPNLIKNPIQSITYDITERPMNQVQGVV